MEPKKFGKLSKCNQQLAKTGCADYGYECIKKKGNSSYRIRNPDGDTTGEGIISESEIADFINYFIDDGSENTTNNSISEDQLQILQSKMDSLIKQGIPLDDTLEGNLVSAQENYETHLDNSPDPEKASQGELIAESIFNDVIMDTDYKEGGNNNKKEEKDDVGESIGKGFENAGKSVSNSFKNVFGGGRNKKKKNKK